MCYQGHLMKARMVEGAWGRGQNLVHTSLHRLTCLKLGKLLLMAVNWFIF